MRPLLRIVAIAVLAASVTACDESADDFNWGSVAGPTPTLQPTFSSIQQNIFENGDSTGRVPCTACHTTAGRPTPAGNLDLTRNAAYAQLVSRASGQRAGAMLVNPGNSASSYLIDKLLEVPGTPIVGRRMPIGGTSFLTPGQIQIIRRWIDTGAPR